MDAEKTGGLSAVMSGSDNTSGEVITGTRAQYGETVRGLSPRHVQLMAIGGSIGTGLWVRPPTICTLLRTFTPER
jgi:yeast amino acid transporter